MREERVKDSSVGAPLLLLRVEIAAEAARS